MLIRFFRLEGKDGFGIYHSVCDNKLSPWDNVTKDGNIGTQQDNIHVMPHNDKKLALTSDLIEDDSYLFGFLNIQQYKSWVYNPIWRQKLSDYGIELCVYEIEAHLLKKSEYQVAFRDEDATLVERLHTFHFN